MVWVQGVGVLLGLTIDLLFKFSMLSPIGP